MSESTQTLQADLCYMKRCSCVVFSLQAGRKDLTHRPKVLLPSPPPAQTQNVGQTQNHHSAEKSQMLFAKFTPAPLINVDHSFRLFGNVVISCLANIVHWKGKGRGTNRHKSLPPPPSPSVPLNDVGRILAVFCGVAQGARISCIQIQHFFRREEQLGGGGVGWGGERELSACVSSLFSLLLGKKLHRKIFSHHTGRLAKFGWILTYLKIQSKWY